MAKQHPAYGEKRDYRPIDVWTRNGVIRRTTWARTLKIAREKYSEEYGAPLDAVRASFA